MKIGSISAIGNITSVRSVSAVQKQQETKSVDTESKSIENDISDVERQKQASSKEDLTVDEKMKRRQELQQELSSLKTKLRISEAEASKENKKEALTDEQSAAKGTEAAEDSRAAQAVKEKAAEAKEKEEAAKEEAAKAEKKEAQTQRMKENASEGNLEKIDTQKKDADQAKAGEAVAGKIGSDGFKVEAQDEKSGVAEDDKKAGAEDDKEKMPGFSKREMQSMISEDEAAKRAEQQGVIVARLENDIVILKGEIKQDEDRGGDVTQKKEELKEQEERAQRAVNAQFSAIGQTNRKLQETVQEKLEETRGENAMTIRRNAAAEQPLIRATNFSLAGVV